MEKVYDFEKRIDNVKAQYERFFFIYDEILNNYTSKDKIIWNIAKCEFMHSNLAALFGALISELMIKKGIRIIVRKNNCNKVYKYLCKNGVLKYNRYGIKPAKDEYNTIIEFNKIDVINSKSVGDVYTKFYDNAFFDNHDETFRADILRIVGELFVNVKQHANVDEAYFIAQYFPNKKELHMSVIDFGSGIYQNVDKHININTSRILWAFKFGNTTKVDDSGGIGLHDIWEFVQKYDGEIKILSGKEFVTLKNNIKSYDNINNNINGTIINVKLKGEQYGY